MSTQVTNIAPLQVQPLSQGSQVLSRKEAKLKLHTLTPCSGEYSKLQNALIGRAGIVEISLPNSSYKVNTASKSCALLGGFGSSEHVAIGEAVKLQGLPENTPLLIKGGTHIHFQYIVALAGDFYGVAGQAISLPGGSFEEKTERFKKAFATLAEADNNQLRRVLLEIRQECDVVRHSSLPHHCYSHQMIEKNNAIKQIKNDIDELLIDNSDHFSINAREAYHVGHTLAMNLAIEAGNEQNLEKLKLAYANDAFACHFLTDLFAAGHIRNQRGELETFLVDVLKFEPKQAKPLAGLLTGAQHEKDGNEGLNVQNGNGEHWRAYGDGNFFAAKNKENREKVIAATQASADEIYYAYSHGEIPDSPVEKLIPYAIPLNPPPIYQIKENSLVLIQDTKEVEITSQANFLYYGIQQAITYLPQDYIDGFIREYLIPKNIPLPILDKVIIPQVERLTGTFWHMIGLATYYQVKQESHQLNEKIDEMADTVLATYQNTVIILEGMRKVNKQLLDLTWSDSFEVIKSAIEDIKDMAYQFKYFRETLEPHQLQIAEDKLWEAFIRMSRVFCEEATTNDRRMLAAYGTMLSNTDPGEIKIKVTLWFRQMLDYQVQACSLYMTSKFIGKRHQEGDAQKHVSTLKSSLIRQIEANQELIEGELIDRHQNYIVLQLEKSKTKRLANEQLNTL